MLDHLKFLGMDRFDCTLWDVLKDHSKYYVDLSDRFKLLVEILEVLVFIQSKKISHKDVKASNIFVRTVVLQGSVQSNKKGIILGKWVLGDFGLSSKITELRGSSGTPGFASMEQFDGKPSPKSDNYSFAKLAVLILFPWNTAWYFLSYPISNTDFMKKPWRNHKIFGYISNLLDVSL